MDAKVKKSFNVLSLLDGSEQISRCNNSTSGCSSSSSNEENTPNDNVPRQNIACLLALISSFQNHNRIKQHVEGKNVSPGISNRDDELSLPSLPTEILSPNHSSPNENQLQPKRNDFNLLNILPSPNSTPTKNNKRSLDSPTSEERKNIKKFCGNTNNCSPVQNFLPFRRKPEIPKDNDVSQINTIASTLMCNFIRSNPHLINLAYNNGFKTSTLTPLHLRKAKLMFFFCRYPSSNIIKTYFPDVHFNKNNTAQLVKWFSNFREFYYIQIEKYSRSFINEEMKRIRKTKKEEKMNVESLKVPYDSELFRALNLHYNRNNQMEVPKRFCVVVEETVKEFIRSILAGKDQEPSWKKAIYKVIARMDDQLPDIFKNTHWLDAVE
ncbi:hypothetical protein SNEBB_001973 [Seison nebaliae]|nr:hypothetical protein SNEBB_001973 [Seison nebaliae]